MNFSFDLSMAAHVAAARRALAAAALAPLAVAAQAQDFAAFRAQFSAAVERNDAHAVAALTAAGFLFEGEPRDAAGFAAIYPQLFTPAVRTCLTRTPVVREHGRYTVACRPYVFYFGKTPGAWRLEEFAADPE